MKFIFYLQLYLIQTIWEEYFEDEFVNEKKGMHKTWKIIHN